MGVASPFLNTSMIVGDIVIVYDEKLPRHIWRLGKIEALIPGGDGCVRGAVVKMGKTGATIKRPVNKLFPLVTANYQSGTSMVQNEGSAISKISVDSGMQPTGTTADMLDSDASRTSSVHGSPTHQSLRTRRTAAIQGETKRRTSKITD